MAGAIGNGDYVECIRNRLPHTAPPIGLVVGRIYRVVASGVTLLDDENPGVPYVRLAGVRMRASKVGFRTEWFRPVLCPQADAFTHLLTTIPNPEPVTA